MTDLTDFLLARIAEDEAVARGATAGPWEVRPYWFTSNGRSWATVPDVINEDIDATDAEHIARWDPARVLAECEAKRRVVEWHKSWPVLVEQRPEFAGPAAGVNDMTFRMTQQIAWATQEEYRKRFGSEPPTAPILRLLALPYAAHPEWREEWRP